MKLRLHHKKIITYGVKMNQHSNRNIKLHSFINLPERKSAQTLSGLKEQCTKEIEHMISS